MSEETEAVCVNCGSHKVYKTDGEGNYWCKRCLDRAIGNYNNRNKRESRKVGRNAPCPCGSGLKYKRCCGKNL